VHLAAACPQPRTGARRERGRAGVGVAVHAGGPHLGEAAERVVPPTAPCQRGDERGPRDHVLAGRFVEHLERQFEAAGLGVGVRERRGDEHGRHGGGVDGERVQRGRRRGLGEVEEPYAGTGAGGSGGGGGSARLEDGAEDERVRGGVRRVGGAEAGEERHGAREVGCHGIAREERGVGHLIAVRHRVE